MAIHFPKNRVLKYIGAHDGITAKLIEKYGFDGVWSSGFEISASYAVPDANILTMSQYLERAEEMRDSINIPILADCDTGYGNAINAVHTVKKFESAGIDAICVEDKLFPKVNSYIAGRQPLARIEEFVGKLEAIIKVRTSISVVARVEALIAKQGMKEAIKRAHAYADVGVDAILIHSKSRSYEEIYEFAELWNKRLPLVIVPTSYPQVSISDVGRLGVSMVVFANVCMRTKVRYISEMLNVLSDSDSLYSVDSYLCTMGEIFELQGMKEFKETEENYLR